jgi:hypothetical protein
MKKQTAVEWLLNEIDMQYPEINVRRKEWMVDKAKEMEKEQIVDAAIWGPNAPSGEQYYKETFNTKEN